MQAASAELGPAWAVQVLEVVNNVEARPLLAGGAPGARPTAEVAAALARLG